MKAVLIIMNLLSTDPVIGVEYPTPEACMQAMREQLLQKPANIQALVTCGPLLKPEIQGEENIDPDPPKEGNRFLFDQPFEQPPKGEKIE